MTRKVIHRERTCGGRYIGVGGPYRRQYMGDPTDHNFSPVARIGGCTLHWKAAWEPFADGAAVTSMKDWSSAGTWTISGSPTMDIDGCNGRPCVNFTTANYAYHSVNQTAPRSIIALARMTGGANSRLISTQAGNWLFGWWSGAMDEFYFEGWVYNPGTGTDTNWHVPYADITGGSTNTNVYWDRVLKASNTAGVGGPNAIRLQGSGVYGETSNCAVAELIIFNRVLPTLEREMLHDYISSYYHLGV